jgi:23S rRNA pseudouridine1911/1915/1917 synthase
VKLVFTIPAELNEQRLDKALATLPEVSTRSRAQTLIEKSLVIRNTPPPLRPTKAAQIVATGEIYELQLPEEATEDLLKPYSYPLDVLYEDDDLIVINKASGLVVHPAAGHHDDTLVNALIHHTDSLSMKFGEDRPGIVHRLDKETSGTLVIAKNDFTHENLARQFKERTVHRVYWAVCFGHNAGKSLPLNFKISSFIARHPVDRKKMASVRDSKGKVLSNLVSPPSHGKWAVTNVFKLQETRQLVLFRLKLETGRTHQIRVHLSEFGTPILGDVLYGSQKRNASLANKNIANDIKNLSRFYLHAAELGFTHPKKKALLSFKTPWPKNDEEKIVEKLYKDRN